MQDQRTIFVTGATGNQGGAVARNLVQQGFRVKALTRHPQSDKAKALARQGIEVIGGDLDDANSFKDHFRNCDGVFSVQSFEHGTEKEIIQGKRLAQLAKEYGIRHFIYTSVAGADEKTGIPHFESKFQIEETIKSLGIPYTIIRPVSLYENFLIPQVKSGILKGKLSSPIDKDVRQQMVGAEDVGRLSARIFLNPENYLSKTIDLAAEQMDLKKTAELFSEVMGKEIKCQKLPMFITRIFMGKDLYKMFSWINKHEGVFIKDFESYKKSNPGLIDLKSWIREKFNPA